MSEGSPTGAPRRSLARVTLVVRDCDEALAFYRGVLGFEVVEDVILEGGRRWLVVAPAGGTGAELLLARAANPEQLARVGDQTGGRVGWFLHTTHFEADHARLLEHGVHFTEPPRDEPYGRVAVFLDLYGNRWDLLEPRPRS